MNKKLMINAFFIFSGLVLASCGQSSGNAPSISSQTGGGGSGGSGGGGSTACNPCKIFGTAVQYSGDILAVGSADNYCASDANKPSGTSTYKVLYIDPGYRDLSTNWILHTNTAYVRPDGTAIGTTDSSGKLPNPLTNSITGQTSTYYWTGISASWTGSTSNCADFTDGSNGSVGIVGRGDFLTIAAVSATGKTCDNSYSLYCVEQ